jgi:protein-disulfide isomerase
MNYVTHFWNYVTTWTLAPTTFTHIKYIINLKHPKMKKTIFFALLTIFSLGALPAFAAKNSPKVTEATETTAKLTEEEISTYRARVEEIRDMDKSELTASEKKELRNELKDIKKTMHKDGTYIYVGGSTLLIIIIILLIL